MRLVAAQVDVRPPVQQRKQRTGMIGNGILYVVFFGAIAREGRDQRAQHTFLLQGLQLVFVQEVFRTVFLAEDEHRFTTDALRLHLAQQADQRGDARTRTHQDQRRVGTAGQMEARIGTAVDAERPLVRQQPAGGCALVRAAVVLVAHLAHAQVQMAGLTVRGNRVGPHQAGRQQFGQLGQRHAPRRGEVLQDIQNVGVVQVLFQCLAVLELLQILQLLVAGQFGQVTQHALADLPQLLVAQQCRRFERAIVFGNRAQQLRVVLGHHVHGIAGAPQHAAAGGVQPDVPGRRFAGVELPAFQQRRLEGFAGAVGLDLQLQCAPGLQIPVEHLLHHRRPLLEELPVVAVGIHPVDQRRGAAFLQQRVHLLREAAEVGVAGVAQPENGIAQVGQGGGCLQQRQEGLGIARRLAVAERGRDDEQRIIALQHAGRDFVQRQNLGRKSLQGRVGGQLLGQCPGIARFRPIADHQMLGDGVHA